MSTWAPATEADIERAIAAGTLTETHYLDLKRQLGSNNELAKDLAAFALDGGALLIGVDEDKETRRPRLWPVPLAGLPERIEQVALQAVDPPLQVRPIAIPSTGDPALGYVFVDVPASPAAPHMVGGAYFGRGETQKRALPDPEVLRLHAARGSADAAAERLLDEEIARDPYPQTLQRNGHVYLVAQPLSAPREAALQLVRPSDADRLRPLVAGVEAGLSQRLRDAAPSMQYASGRARRANGTALHNLAGTTESRGRPRDERDDAESSLVDVEFREDGGIRALIGRATGVRSVNGALSEVVLDAVIVGYTRRLVGWAAAVGADIGYRGGWMLGLQVTRLAHLRSATLIDESGAIYGSGGYDAPGYRSVTQAQQRELAEYPGAVAGRLAGRLVRGLGTWDRFGPHLE